MSCAWTEEHAYRFAEGSLEPQPREAFADHLNDCSDCRERVAEARRVDDLLRAGITPVPAPAGLASKVANAVAGERERRGFGRPWLLQRRRSLLPLVAALAAVLVLGLVAVFAAPGAVMAVVQRALVFIPGLGINRVDEGNLVSTGVAVLRQGNVTFTVEALLSNGKETKLEFSVAGLPGGKGGRQGQDGSKPRPPFLRDASGRQYAMLSGYYGTGGSAAENRIEGGATFPPLPGDLRSVDLVMPADWLVPPAVLAGSNTQEWVVRLQLSPPAESGLSRAMPQTASQTVRGVTLRVAASNVERERTVVLLEGEAEGAAQLLFVGRVGRNAAEAAVLRDDLGRSYKLIPQGGGLIVHGESFRQDLYFEPLAPGARQLTLEVPAVQTQEKGEVSFTIPLASRKGGESFALDRTVTLGGHKIQLKTATLGDEDSPKGGGGPEPQATDPKPLAVDPKAARLGEEQGQRGLYVDVDLGPTVDGRTLASFSVKGSGGWSSSFGSGDGSQLDRFGVPVDPTAKEVEIHLELPLVVVEGPWKLSFPAAGN